jgi:hypothetical protein
MKFQQMQYKCPWRSGVRDCKALGINKCTEKNCGIWFFMTMELKKEKEDGKDASAM